MKKRRNEVGMENIGEDRRLEGERKIEIRGDRKREGENESDKAGENYP